MSCVRFGPPGDLVAVDRAYRDVLRLVRPTGTGAHPVARVTVTSPVMVAVCSDVAKGPAMNVVVLQGELSRPAERRELPSGDTVVALEVTVRPPGAAAESVPVAWP